jgi:hypothetical protein
MSVFLSPVFGAGAQLFTSQGVVLNGGKIYVYVAGSTTATDTWTTAVGDVKNSNPIVLDTAGRTPQEIWLLGGVLYKFVVTDSAGNVQGQTWDNIPGVNDTAFSVSQWQASGSTPSYVSATSFTVTGDQTGTFQVGRRTKSAITGGYTYSTIKSATYVTGVTTITLINDSTSLNSGLSSVQVALLTPTNSSLGMTAVSSKTAPLLIVSKTTSFTISSTGNPIIFDAVYQDSWSAYNSSTGIYTTPISGVYQINYTINFAILAATSKYVTLTDTAYAGGTLISVLKTLAAGAQDYLSGSVVSYIPAGISFSLNMATNDPSATFQPHPNATLDRGIQMSIAYLGS